MTGINLKQKSKTAINKPQFFKANIVTEIITSKINVNVTSYIYNNIHIFLIRKNKTI